ncbi:OmpP1/FadL family transporter [Sulfitobacter aestuarii]|uniref:OmpP1/FadL family transporter n=1 Tax=Sulfitobacter aestuarii TaxID=2161676 RepID=A0ABW5U1T3_9RHOB
MTRNLIAIAALMGSASTVAAGGLDRSGQKIGVLFETGNLFELSYGHVDPSVDGVENGSTLTTNTIGDVADSFGVLGAGLKYQFNERVSMALIVDEPYGSDITYPGNPAVTALGGTSAIVDSFAITALGRYKFDDNWSMHGGLRYQEIEADVTLGGNAYGGLNGYNGAFGSDGAVGYIVGAAYERPEIALRVALTYNSKIDHDLPTVETVGGFVVNPGSETEVTAPESLNLDFQTGIAQDTLLFGSIRYARHEDVIVSPAFFDSQVDPANSGSSLTDIENSTDIEIGIGHRFTDRFSGSLAVGYQTKGEDDLVSPLAPTNGARWVSLGGSYKMTDQVKLSGGVRYTELGDAQPQTAGTARADFEDNSAVSVGFKISYNF